MKIIGSYGPLRTQSTRVAALIAAAMVTAMLLAQLYGYEDLAVTLGAVLPFNQATTLSVIAAVIVIVELLSLPYLLGMYLSRLMRILCGAFAAGVSVLWLFTCFTNSHASNSGLFSTTLELSGGIIATAWSLLLFAAIVVVIKADTQTDSLPLEKKSDLR